MRTHRLRAIVVALLFMVVSDGAIAGTAAVAAPDRHGAEAARIAAQSQDPKYLNFDAADVAANGRSIAHDQDAACLGG